MSYRAYSAFVQSRLIASGILSSVLASTKEYLNAAGGDVLIFEDETGSQVDFELRGTPAEVIARAQAPSLPKVGRPKLGVVAREVTLLPRHWDWLETQRGGASATLRRLLDEARKQDEPQDRRRRAQSAAGNFLSAMAGNVPGYEEACRALYADDRKRFDECMSEMPPDVRAYALRISQAC